MAESEEGCSTNLVILKILSRRRARRTLMPKEVPGLKKPHSTSKMLPTMTYRDKIRNCVATQTDIEEESAVAALFQEHKQLDVWEEQNCRERDGVLTLQSKQLKEEWK